MTVFPLKKSIRSAGCYVKNNRIIILFFLIVFLALCLGPSFSETGIFADICNRILLLSLDIHAKNNLFYIFLFSLSSSFISIFVLYLSGLSVCGLVAAPFLLFFHGFTVAVFSGCCYLRYHSTGLLLFLAIYFLPLLISLTASVIAARESFVFSGIILTAFSAKHDPVNFNTDFRLYSLRQLFVLIIDVLAAVLSVVLNIFFFRLFSIT